MKIVRGTIETMGLVVVGCRVLFCPNLVLRVEVKEVPPTAFALISDFFVITINVLPLFIERLLFNQKLGSFG